MSIHAIALKILLSLTMVPFLYCYAHEPLPCSRCSSQEILEGKIPLNNLRYETFIIALNLLSRMSYPIIVETGTSRYGKNNCLGDGCSTIIFAEWIKTKGGQFYSVDINQNHLNIVKESLGESSSSVNLIHSDSVEFLRTFNQPIDFLYLDSYGFQLTNPTPSQEHHLKEIIAAYPWLTEKSIIMIDDCDLPHGGKGKLAIEWLLDKGWVILANQYQVILARDPTLLAQNLNK